MEPSLDFRVGLVYLSHRPLSRMGRTFIMFMKDHRDKLLKRVQTAARCDGHHFSRGHHSVPATRWLSVSERSAVPIASCG